MGFFHLQFALLLCIAGSAQSIAQEIDSGDAKPADETEQVPEPTLKDQIRLAANRVCILEVAGSRPTKLLRLASAFLIAPDRAVTSARSLAGGYGVRVRIRHSVTEAKLVGLDLLHDIAILKLQSSFDLKSGLKLHGTELLGNEKVAILGTTAAMNQTAGLGSLIGVTQPSPLSTFGLAKKLSHPRLQGAPILNVQGHVVGMITSYIHRESDTRFLISSAAILAVPPMDPVNLTPGLIPADSKATEQGIPLFLDGQAERAIDLLEGKSTQRSAHWLALSLMACDRNRDAIDRLNAQIKGHPNDPTAFLLRGQAHERLMENAAAASNFLAARGLSENGIYSTMSLARTYAKVGRGQESLRFLRSLMAQSPKYAPATLLRGEIYAGRLRLAEARGCYERVLDIDPDHPSAWIGLGQIFLIQKSADKALTCFERALHASPTNLEAKIGMVEVRIQEKQWDKALQRLKPLMKEHPAHAKIILLTAHTYGRSRELEKARDLYEQATLLFPSNKDAYLGLGTTYKEMAQYERAIAAFDDVLRIEPKHAGAIFSAGFCYLLLGDRGEARARYKTLRFIDPVSAGQLFKMIYNK
ncbi:MAG: tetratricopeptide repeat protein [bacterium]|nr:tetratricopeptide repeat protein [bacterium]